MYPCSDGVLRCWRESRDGGGACLWMDRWLVGILEEGSGLCSRRTPTCSGPVPFDLDLKTITYVI